MLVFAHSFICFDDSQERIQDIFIGNAKLYTFRKFSHIYPKIEHLHNSQFNVSSQEGIKMIINF